ncbi:MAG: hypothetical protein K0U82_10015, partial [Planctomycetes bacterium]|nr:hypothetical protein [Planctomycetota bacterium]
ADPITSLAAALKADPHPDKVGLCQGKYLTDWLNAGVPVLSVPVDQSVGLIRSVDFGVIQLAQ